MANYSVTISNTVNVFGPESTNKWGGSWGAVWGNFLWGYGNSDLDTRVVKLLEESLSLTDSVTVSVYFYKVISETLNPTTDMGSETLQDGSGYYYVFPDNTTDAENRDFPTWAEGSVTAQSFTCQAVGGTSWS